MPEMAIKAVGCTRKYVIWKKPIHLTEHPPLLTVPFLFYYSFTPPSVTPAMMNFERKRYTMMIGTIATVIIM